VRLFLSAGILAYDRISDRGFETPYARRPDI